MFTPDTIAFPADGFTEVISPSLLIRKHIYRMHLRGRVITAK